MRAKENIVKGVRAAVLAAGVMGLGVGVRGESGAAEGAVHLPERVEVRGGVRIAIVGSVAPGNASSGRYVAEAVKEINLLGPSAVFTVGNLVPGETRSEQRYREEVEGVKGALGALKMPWFPCVGETDVVPGTRDAGDRRFEGLYEKLMGPRYYAVDVGEVHVIVLDSEENLDPFGAHALGEQQMGWLRGELNRTFEGAAAEGQGERPAPRYVVVLLHRALWKERGSGWEQVHRLLVRFNERPIVSVEGEGAADAGPRVVGVYASAAEGSGYALEPTRDGIRYVELGPTGARVAQDTSIMPRHFTVLRFDGEGGGGLHAAVVQLVTPEGGPAIAGEALFTAGEREVLDKIAAIPNGVMGVEGAVESTASKGAEGSAAGSGAAGAAGSTGGSGQGKLTMHVGNPLEVPLDVEVRLASARNLGSVTMRENANPFVENLDAPWEMDSAHLIRHLAPGAKESWPMSLTWTGGEGAGGGGKGPAQVEFVVHWRDPRGGGAGGMEEPGRMCTVVLKRRVPVVPHADVPVEEKVSMAGETGWLNAVQGSAYAWQVRGDALQRRNPEWEMTADAQKVYVRFRVEDGVKSYVPPEGEGGLDWRWGGLGSDAVSVAWQVEGGGVKRLWVLPFGPKGAELWMNEGVGEKQTELRCLEEGSRDGVEMRVAEETGGYRVVMAIPRELLFGLSEAGAEKGVRVNLGVMTNDEGAETWGRSWAPEGAGPAVWGVVRVAGAGGVAGTRPAAGE
ncbi:MAG: metallophosphoesterase family protein [Phycisphaerae bacterium]